MNSQPRRGPSMLKKNPEALRKENVLFLFNEMLLSLKATFCGVVILHVQLKCVDQKKIQAIILCKIL